MSFFGSVFEVLIDPTIAGFIGEQGGQAFVGVKQEAISRLAGFIGVPGNHDIERAVRVAQLQAMIVSLNAYENLVSALEKIDTPVDPEHNPKGFVKETNRHINRVFRKRATVQLAPAFCAHVRESISLDLDLGARGERGDTKSDAVTLDFVVAEFCRAGGREVLPPRFGNLLYQGEGDCLPWIVNYRAFLCEQVKSNPRFASILNATMLEGLRRGNVDLADGQAEIAESLRRVAQDQQSLMGMVGDTLASLESTAIFMTDLADRVAAEILGLQDGIERSVELLEKQENTRLHIRKKKLFRSPSSGSAGDSEAMSAFHYAQAVDPFVGRIDKVREIEADLLDATLVCDRLPRFRWMALCGEGGSGKSRLAMAVLGRNSDAWKHAGFAGIDVIQNPEKVFEVGQVLEGPTLIVVDYTVNARADADLPGYMRAWADYADTERAHPVCIIVITRKSNDIILNEIRGIGINPLADMSLVSAAEIPASPMVLGPLTDDATLRLMRARIRITANEMRIEPVDLSDEQLLSKLGSFDPRRRPLFAAMVAAELQRGALPEAESSEEVNRLLLFGHYLQRQYDKFWLPRATALSETTPSGVVVRHANLVRLATCCGGLPVNDISCRVPAAAPVESFHFPQLSVAEQSGAIRNQLIWTMTGELVRVDADDTEDDWFEASSVVPTLEPDLLGERFFLMMSDELRNAPNAWQTPKRLSHLAWRCAPDATAAFLRMAAQDYPLRMHEMRWLPPASSETDEHVLKARARMLRNLCADIATRYGPAMPTARDLGRLFDIVDEFGAALVELAKSDHETREDYGQILRQVTNIAARLGNAAIPYIDPIAAVEDPITVVEDEAGAAPAARGLTETFSHSGLAPDVEDDEGTSVARPGLAATFSHSGSITDASARLDADDGPPPLPEDLAEIIRERLPPLLDRARHFVLSPGPYLERRPFEAVVAEILGSVHFRHRDNRRFGGRWPSPRDKDSEDVVSKWREHAETLADGSVDDVAVMAGLMSSISYAEFESTARDYRRIYAATRRALDETKSVHPIFAARMAAMLGNSVVHSPDAERLTDEERAHISDGLDLFMKLIVLVDFSETVAAQQMRRMISSFTTTTFKFLIQAQKTSDPRAPEVAERFARLLCNTPEDTPLPLHFLSVLTNLPEDTDAEILAELHDAIRTRLVNGAIDGHNFRSPNSSEPVDQLCQLAFGVPLERLRLPENLAFDLLVALDREVGAKATRAALKAIASTVEADGEARARVPIDLARRYLAHVKVIHGFDGRDHVSAATMAVWAHDLLRGDCERAKSEIDALWRATGEPGAARGRTLAVWGAALMIDATRTPDAFTDSWSGRLREIELVSGEPDLSRSADVGLSADGGLDEGETERSIHEHSSHEHNEALIDACMAAARLHVLNGGDPANWMQGDLS